MPNWCENELKIEGSKQVIDLFVAMAKADKKPLSLNNFVPYPKCYENLALEKKTKRVGFNGYGCKEITDGYYCCVS